MSDLPLIKAGSIRDLDDAYLSELLEPQHDDFCWLGYGADDVPPANLGKSDYDRMFNQEDPKDIVYNMVERMFNPRHFGFTCKHLLNIELPAYQAVILRQLWNHTRPMLIATRGASKSFLLAVYAILRLIYNQGCQFVIVGAGLRQSKIVYEYMVKIYQNAPMLQDLMKSFGGNKTDKNLQGPKGSVDRFEFRIGKSLAIACPVGDGERIRGYRANYIACDEYASLDHTIFNEVIKAFANVKQDPVGSMKRAAKIKKLRDMGIDIEEESSTNQIILSGTPKHEFNHFYAEFRKYQKLIESKLDPKTEGKELDLTSMDKADYCIVRIPHTSIPDGFLDKKNVEDARESMPTSMFNREYGACFIADSDGFYKRSILEAATTTEPIVVKGGKKVSFDPETHGETNSSYVMGVDPAKDRDNAAISLIKIQGTHREIVYCWTFNKQKFDSMKTKGGLEDEYYAFIAKKIKYLMSLFPVSAIAIDKFGGGEAIIQALAEDTTEDIGIPGVFPVIDPDKKHYTDAEDGLHIIHSIAANATMNSEANHGMLSDFQQKRLLFPAYDPVEMARQAIVQNARFDYLTDSYEDIVIEIEALKEELESIILTPTARFGQDHFDTPTTKIEVAGEIKKARMKKDRYSALLYANWIIREEEIRQYDGQQYNCYGTSNKDRGIGKIDSDEFKKGQMYYGRGINRLKDPAAIYR